MKKLVSTTLALAMLAAPVGVMASSADQVNQNTCSIRGCTGGETEKPKKSHKLRNALIIGATVAGVAVISVATHKAVSKACATKSENKMLNAICDTNSKFSEISTKAVNFVSDNIKAVLEKVQNLFVRKNAKSGAEANIAATTEAEQLVATVDTAATTEEEQPAVLEESSDEKGSEEETAATTVEEQQAIEEEESFEEKGSEEENFYDQQEVVEEETAATTVEEQQAIEEENTSANA